MRVLRWAVERCRGQANAMQTPVGWMPRFEALDWRGLENFSRGQFAELMSIGTAQWRIELREHEALFEKLRSRLPHKLQLDREMFGLIFV